MRVVTPKPQRHLRLVGGTDTDPIAFRILGDYAPMGLSDGDAIHNQWRDFAASTREVYEVMVLPDGSTLVRPAPPTPL